ncbi:MAG: hypothetical protein CM1200mP24_06160 [Gammaproteobacteria bacterium]|nr:MAG: hypothetical protein CM1200mP24_06160 [Gammaproteobacteria bacterium]
MGLSFMQHAYMNEILAKPRSSAVVWCSCSKFRESEDSVKYGTPEQHEKWLIPLTEGRMQSGFSMTEPMKQVLTPVINHRAELDGDEWVINGQKGFTSNGHAADFYIFMCRTSDPDEMGGVNEKMTQIIAPKESPRG